MVLNNFSSHLPLKSIKTSPAKVNPPAPGKMGAKGRSRWTSSRDQKGAGYPTKIPLMI